MADIEGTPGDDILIGTPCDDRIDGKNGDDKIYGRGGNDLLLGGNGRDRIFGGEGDDVIYGGNDADVLKGGNGNDEIYGENGDDCIDGGDGNDVVSGGQGQDYILGGRGDDDLSGDEGDDCIDGGKGADQISGGSGNDYLRGGKGNDVIAGDDGDDRIYGGVGDDELYGGQGNDKLYGGDGDDFLSGGKNDDKMYGGNGDDRFHVAEGNDLADGGFGNDVFYVEAGEHNIIGGEDPDGKDIDVLDLSGAGNYTIKYTGPESGTIEFRDSHGNITRRARFKEIERIICFTPGTGIATMQGERLVEDLRVGDRVFTRDNGAQEIRWIGRKKITLGAGSLSQKLQPILIRKGALGYGLPGRDTLVSPNHRVLLSSQQAQLYFNESEVLVAAKHMVGMPGIEHWMVSEVEYIHFLCDNHEIVLSNNAWTETFQPGDYSMSGLGDPQREEIYNLFPELKMPAKSGVFSAARRSLKRYEAELICH
ncbi:MAG: Hint domain-containing protein [Paracoccaceae bacterium]